MNAGIIIFVVFCLGIYIGSMISRQYRVRELYNAKENFKKKTEYYCQLNQWFMQYLEGKRIEKYFNEKGIKKIGIYGWNELAARLCDELKNADVEIVSIVDRQAKNLQIDIPVYSTQEELPEFDILVVTASYYFYEIREEMSKKVPCSIVALGDILCDL